METVAFVAKKVISRVFLFPVGFGVCLGLTGFWLWRRRPKSGWGPLLVLAGLVIWLLLSMPWVGGALLIPLERHAGPYADPARLQAQGIESIVVLSAGIRQGPRSTTDRLNGSGANRVLEGVRLWKRIPGANLVFTGGGSAGGWTEARAMAVLARELGVPESAIIIEERSWDTEDQAFLLRPLLAGRPFALVTSAAHMPRSLKLFRRMDLKPIPAPTEFHTIGRRITYDSFLPQAGGLNAAQTALYEYWGNVWVWLKGLAGSVPGDGG